MYHHFLQSKNWETFLTEKENKTVFRLKDEKSNLFEALVVLEKTPLGNYLFCPYGPSLDESSPKKALTAALKSLKSLARDVNAFFIRIEPTLKFPSSTLKSLNLSPSKDINPANTWVLDLRPEKSDLLKSFAQGTRTRYNTFAKKGLSVRVSKNPKDIKYLVKLQNNLAKEKGINTFSSSYLKHELEMPFASLYLVEYEAKIIAASLFFDDPENNVRFYMQSAADSAYKKLPATVALLSTSIFDAKDSGLTSFDFWGIAPDNAPKDHPWLGFTAFKKSFGGSEKNYSGTLDLPLNKPKYTLYKLLRKLNLLKRKLLKS